MTKNFSWVPNKHLKFSRFETDYPCLLSPITLIHSFHLSSLSQLMANPLSSGIDQKTLEWDFPGSPVVKSLPFNAGSASLIPAWGAKITNTSWQKKKKKHKREAML